MMMATLVRIFFSSSSRKGHKEMAGAVTLSERGMQMKDELD